MDPRIYILFGYPGSGKGTFSQAIKVRGYRHISTGEILREEVKKKTPIGLRYKNEIETSSNLLPKRIIQKIILRTIRLSLAEKKNLILDGFPKTIEQAKYLDELLDKHSLTQNAHIIYLDVPIEQALERIQTRRTCYECEKIYNLQTAKPKINGKCDTCSGSLVQRPCDNAESFYKRLLLFHETVAKVISYYEANSSLIKIDTNKPLKDFINQVITLDENR
jgi:adenylate kinase